MTADCSDALLVEIEHYRLMHGDEATDAYLRFLALRNFLLARIAEDEGAAREIPPGVFEDACSISRSYEFVFRHDPARVLAECEAKRQVIKLHGPGSRDPNPSTLRALISAYADHPDYLEEWRAE